LIDAEIVVNMNIVSLGKCVAAKAKGQEAHGQLAATTMKSGANLDQRCWGGFDGRRKSVGAQRCGSDFGGSRLKVIAVHRTTSPTEAIECLVGAVSPNPVQTAAGQRHRHR
jgi:hypothetical protein